MPVDSDEQSLEELGRRVNEIKSNFNLMMLDKDSQRTSPASRWCFRGLANLMNAFPSRIAMAVDIPETRFRGSPPTGMNATGESDMRNHVMMVEAKRVVRLAQPLPRLDAVLARDAGLSEAPSYRWLSLIELSEEDIARAAVELTKAYQQALATTAITEVEIRRQLDGHPVFGSLPEEDWRPPEPDPEPVPGGPIPPEDDDEGE